MRLRDIDGKVTVAQLLIGREARLAVACAHFVAEVGDSPCSTCDRPLNMAVSASVTAGPDAALVANLVPEPPSHFRHVLVVPPTQSCSRSHAARLHASTSSLAAPMACRGLRPGRHLGHALFKAVKHPHRLDEARVPEFKEPFTRLPGWNRRAHRQSVKDNDQKGLPLAKGAFTPTHPGVSVIPGSLTEVWGPRQCLLKRLRGRAKIAAHQFIIGPLPGRDGGLSECWRHHLAEASRPGLPASRDRGGGRFALLKRSAAISSRAAATLPSKSSPLDIRLRR